MEFKKLFFILLASLSIFIQVHGQVDSTRKSGRELFNYQIKSDSIFSFRPDKGYVPMLLHNFGEQAVAPFKMSERHVFHLIAFAGITATLIYFDEDIEKFIRPIKEENDWIEPASSEYTEIGDYYGYSLLALYGISSFAIADYKSFQTAMLMSQALITAGTWARTVKILTGRTRPIASYSDPEYEGDHWFGPFAQFNPKYNSTRGIGSFDAFPSGHTAAAFSMATVLAMQYHESKVVPVASYSLATLVGITRLIEHEHWASDVVVGAALGYLCGKQVVQHYRKIFPQYADGQPRRKKKSDCMTFLSAGKNNLALNILITY